MNLTGIQQVKCIRESPVTKQEYKYLLIDAVACK